MNVCESLLYARKAGAPLVAVNTADQNNTVRTIARTLTDRPVVVWDLVRGCNALSDKDAPSKAVAQSTGEGDKDVTVNSPVKMLVTAQRFPARTVVFMMNMDNYLKQDAPAVLQAVMNLRDTFKANKRQLVMLSTDLQVPACLKDDILVFDDQLPTKEELVGIVRTCDNAASLNKPDRPKANDELIEKVADALTGINTFAAETAVAMSIREDGIDLDFARSQKRAKVAQTKGLTIYTAGEKFSDLGGLEQLKTYLTRIMNGRKRVRLVVWLDEVEKTGLANRNDSSGVNSDQEGTLLSYMEDKDVYGAMLLGVPGCGKSAICKAMAAEFDCVVIRVDLGAMQDVYVGASQQRIRQALKVIEAVGGEGALWLATSNSIDGLSSAMRSRFTDTFFFDLPTREERTAIWKVWLKRFGLKDKPWADDEGWVGRNIRQCCDKAYRMSCSVAEAAEFVIAEGSKERDEIERLRRQADSRYLSVGKPGVYRSPTTAAVVQGRAIDLDD